MRKLLLALGLSALLVLPASAFGQVNIGAQGAWSDDFDFGVGGRVWVGLPVPQAPLAAFGEFDWFFPDVDGVDYWEINANVVYLLPVQNPIVSPYGGAGLNIATADGEVAGISASNTEVGLNLLVGTNINLQAVRPYADARFEVGGGEQFVITAGVAFNVGPGL